MTAERAHEGGRGRVTAGVRRLLAGSLAPPLERLLARVVRAEVDRVLQEIRAAEHRARRDIVAAGERDAARSSARFAEAVMPNGRWFPDPHDTLVHALALAPQGGLALEFGVWAGRSLRVIAEARGGREVYGFDSFQSAPEDDRWDVTAGTFALDDLPVIAGAQIVVGRFADTLPGFLAEHPGRVDFVHIDSDLYSSAVTVLDAVGPRLGAGSVVIFDEYFNYPGWEQHEHRAWREWLERTGTTAEYVAYTSIHEQVVARIVAPGPGLRGSGDQGP